MPDLPAYNQNAYIVTDTFERDFAILNVGVYILFSLLALGYVSNKLADPEKRTRLQYMKFFNAISHLALSIMTLVQNSFAGPGFCKPMRQGFTALFHLAFGFSGILMAYQAASLLKFNLASKISLGCIVLYRVIIAIFSIATVGGIFLYFGGNDGACTYDVQTLGAENWLDIITAAYSLFVAGYIMFREGKHSSFQSTTDLLKALFTSFLFRSLIILGCSFGEFYIKVNKLMFSQQISAFYTIYDYIFLLVVTFDDIALSKTMKMSRTGSKTYKTQIQTTTQASTTTHTSNQIKSSNEV